MRRHRPGGGFVKSLAPIVLAGVVAAAAWYGWVYFLHPADGSSAKLWVYINVLIVMTAVGAFSTRAPWVGLFAPFALAHGVLWEAHSGAVGTDGLESVGAVLAVIVGLIVAMVVGTLAVLLRVEGRFRELVRVRDLVAAAVCMCVGMLLWWSGP